MVRQGSVRGSVATRYNRNDSDRISLVSGIMTPRPASPAHPLKVETRVRTPLGLRRSGAGPAPRLWLSSSFRNRFRNESTTEHMVHLAGGVAQELRKDLLVVVKHPNISMSHHNECHGVGNAAHEEHRCGAVPKRHGG